MLTLFSYVVIFPGVLKFAQIEARQYSRVRKSTLLFFLSNIFSDSHTINVKRELFYVDQSERNYKNKTKNVKFRGINACMILFQGRKFYSCLDDSLALAVESLTDLKE